MQDGRADKSGKEPRPERSEVHLQSNLENTNELTAEVKKIIKGRIVATSNAIVDPLAMVVASIDTVVTLSWAFQW